MAFLSIASTNPNFSHVMCKNPNTIRESGKPFERSLRKGKVYGWYANNDTVFNFWFVDSETEVSFSDKPEFEYLDTTRYSHPFLYNQIITEFARSATQGVEEYDTPTETNSCFVTGNLKINLRLLSRLNMGDSLSYDLRGGGWAKVTVAGTSVKQALNLFLLVTILATIDNNDLYVPLNIEVVSRYLRLLNAADAPYNLRHLFISRVINNIEVFNRLQAEGLIDTDKYHFEYGNTQQQRHRFIKGALLEEGSQGTVLNDIGCGEMYHSLRLCSFYETIFAFDASPEVHEINKNRIAKQNIDNIVSFACEVNADNIKNLLPDSETDILMSEVLEHMDREVAHKTVLALLETDFNRIVITLPNRDFNKYYGMEEGEMRHPDHKWEPTFQEVTDMFNSLPPELGALEVTVCRVGDLIQGESLIPSTIGVIIKQAE